jgi:hypothetical protein
MGSMGEPQRTLVAASSAKSAAFEISSSVPKWLLVAGLLAGPKR